MNDEKPQIDPGNDPRAWADLAKSDPTGAERLWRGLTPEQRLRLALAASGRERERLLVMSPDAGELTQALPPDEFSRTALDLGPADSGELLGLASAEQITYLLDLTGWWKERFAPARYEVWLPGLFDSGPRPLGRWLESADMEVLALLFAHWFKVVKFVASSDEQEPPDTLPSFTLDGVYFIEFRNKKTSGFVAQVLVQLKSDWPERYTGVLETMMVEPASQLASDALRWRTGRLADHGFPERVEALELWAKPRPGEANWAKLPLKSEIGFTAGHPPRSDAVLNLLPQGETLPQAAGGLEPEEADALRAELAYVANCGVVALDADPAQGPEVAKAGQESLGLVNLGLEILAAQGGDNPKAILARVPLAALARQGTQAMRGLNKAAWELIDQGWLAKMPTGLHVLEFPLDRCLAGLLFPRPRFHDASLPADRDYRSFRGLADLEHSRRQLDKAVFWGRLLFELMGLNTEAVAKLFEGGVWPQDRTEIKTTHILGTWLACRALGLAELAPIPAKETSRAVAALQKGLAGPLAKEVMASVEALGDSQQAALAGNLLRTALGKLADELGGINLEIPIELGFISGLVLEAC